MTKPVPKPPRRQFTLAKLLTLVAVWGVASAWPRWLLERPWLPGGWGADLFVALFYLLPVGMPLTLLLMRGWRVLPWLAVGLSAAAALMAYEYVRLTRAHVTFNWPESLWLPVVFGGLGAGCGGDLGLLIAALRQRHWYSACSWALLATVGGAAFWMLRWLVLYAG